MGVRRSGVALPPAAGTIHRSKFVAEERRKTIRRPSGDHVGSPSPGLVVSRRARLPSAFITQMPDLPTIPREKAILARPGDHSACSPPRMSSRRPWPDGRIEYSSGGFRGAESLTVR